VYKEQKILGHLRQTCLALFREGSYKGLALGEQQISLALHNIELGGNIIELLLSCLQVARKNSRQKRELAPTEFVINVKFGQYCKNLVLQTIWQHPVILFLLRQGIQFLCQRREYFSNLLQIGIIRDEFSVWRA